MGRNRNCMDMHDVDCNPIQRPKMIPRQYNMQIFQGSKALATFIP